MNNESKDIRDTADDKSSEIDWSTAKALIDSIPYYAMLVDEDHNIVLPNDKVCAHLKASAEDISGKYCPKLIHGLDGPYPGCPLEEARDRGVGLERELYDRRRSLWVKAIIYPTQLRTKAGKAVFLHMVPDITKEKQDEIHLKESEERYHLLFDICNDAVFINKVDDDGTIGEIIEVNQAACDKLGYTREELLACHELNIAGALNNVANKSAKQSLLLEKRALFNVTMRSREGKPIPCEVKMRYFDYHGERTVLSIVRDTADLLRKEDEREEGLRLLERSIESTIKTISMVVEMRDPYTSGHQQRVSRIACAIAKEMGLSNDVVEGIRIAGLLHDVGKINIPAEILSRPGSISDLEYDVIKAHPVTGYEVLKHTKFPYKVAEITLQHHERLNGSGYPDGLRNDQIMLEARIIGVADVIEAMSSRRPYREAPGIRQALEEIKEKSGILYDASVVDACQRVFADKDYDVDKLCEDSAAQVRS